MNVIETEISEVKIIEPKVHGDPRGFFLETFQAKRYAEMVGIESPFVQDNYSRSRKGVLRGLHFQKTCPQGKLLRVVRGEIFDVAVDIRKGSATFGQWVGEVLSEDNQRQLWVPPGFAHGFAVLSEIADLEYKCTDYYDPSDEGCLIWNDEQVSVDWPVLNPLLSEKDQRGEPLKNIVPVVIPAQAGDSQLT